jgi:hypothetical protein
MHLDMTDFSFVLPLFFFAIFLYITIISAKTDIRAKNRGIKVDSIDTVLFGIVTGVFGLIALPMTYFALYDYFTKK